MHGIQLSRVTRTYTLGSEEFNALNNVDLSIANGDCYRQRAGSISFERRRTQWFSK
jgi:hypothetical protein